MKQAADGSAGLVAERVVCGVLDRADPRWLDAARQAIAERVAASRPVERWFKTLGEGLLAVLPGYKGPDVHAEGKGSKRRRSFFLDELEQTIREWVGLYHRSAHRGLVPEFPGLQLSPLEMLGHVIDVSGFMATPSGRWLRVRRRRLGCRPGVHLC